MTKTYTFWSRVDAFFSPMSDGAISNSQANSFFGRFIYTVGSGATLRNAYYDTAAATGANKIKYIDSDTKNAGATVKDVSSNGECMITGTTTAASLYVHFFNFTSNSATS